jgi:cytochrome c biogenesis protein CcmG/thiol:disulfide interchange protein DsbE
VSNYYYIDVLRKSLLFALLLTLVGCYDNSRPTRIGSAAPDFVLQDGEHKVALHDFRGQVVVLNFWATWCPPCVEETPSMVQMADKVKSKGVTVIGVSVDVDKSAFDKFVKDNHMDYVLVRDPEQKSSALYGTTGWPETFIIDRQGVLRRKFVGPVNWDDPEIISYITNL